MKALIVICAMTLTLGLTGCGDLMTPEEEIREKGRVVQACVESGGNWFNAGDGFGSQCHFDTREGNK